MTDEVTIGVMGGSGLYAMAELTDVEERRVSTPFGEPSDVLTIGSLHGIRVAFLPRHGRGHRLLPSEIPVRANIYALKSLGVRWLLAASAVGSMREEIAPGHLVLPDQFIDCTYARPKTFFGGGIVAHVAFADPVCPQLRAHLGEACRAARVTVHERGTYVCIEGPQFSTRAESELYRSWGVHVIGMTAMPEAKLAREAEICYATVAMVTDYDCWHPDHDHVTVDMVLKVLFQNADKAKALVKATVPLAARDAACPQGCRHALDNAIITPEEMRDPVALAKLDAIAARVFGKD
jgi:5'-methylthioadenosine phosphorylase